MYEVIIILEDGRKIPISMEYEALDHLEEIINPNLDYVINPFEITDSEYKYQRLKKEIEDSTSDGIVSLLEGYWEQVDMLQEQNAFLIEQLKAYRQC